MRLMEVHMNVRNRFLAAAGLALASMAGPALSTASAETVYWGCAKNGKVIPGSITTDGPAPCGDGAIRITWTQGRTTIVGLVSENGERLLGDDYTVTQIGPGDYRLDFPPGTWSSFPVITVTPFGLPGAFTTALVSYAVSPGDGSVEVGIVTSSTVGVWTPHDVAFFFIAAASQP